MGKSSNAPDPPKMQVSWAAVAELLRQCGFPEPDRRWIRGIEYDGEDMVLTVTRIRLNDAGFRTQYVGADGRDELLESFQLLVTT